MPALEAVAAQAMLFHEGARAYALLDGARVPVAVIKGAATGPLLWRDGERSMTDVDLLVPPRRLREARAIFAARGGAEWALVETPRRPLGVRLHRAFTVKSARGVLIDVHGAVAQTARWPHDVDGILSRSLDAKLGRHAVRRACDEDCILIAALNAAKDEHALASSGIEDIARLAAQRAVAWDDVVARARAWRATVATWVALERARTAHGARIPVQVVDALRPRRARARALVVALDAARWHTSRRMRQAVVGPLLTDSPARFAASAVGFAAVRTADGALSGAGQAVASLRRFIKGVAP